MKPRLSMKLLWKLLTEYQKTEEYENAQMGDFLNFVEVRIKTPSH